MAKSIVLPGFSGTYTNFSRSSSSMVSRTAASIGKNELVESVSYNPGGNNPFLMRRVFASGGTVNGKYCKVSEASGQIYANYPLNLYSSASVSGADFSAPVSLAGAFGAANPYRPVVLLPAFLAELRELPKMIRDLGRLKLNKKPIYGFKPVRGVAKDWVSINFGWMPLVGDLFKLIDIGIGIDSRQREVDRLYSGSGLKRRLNLGTQQGSSFFNTDIPPGNAPFTSETLSGTRMCKSWFVVVYKPKTNPKTGYKPKRPSGLELRKRMLGLTSDTAIAAAWELLPWSWLIDYAWDIGSYLQSKASGYELSVERACLMQHFTLEVSSRGQFHTDRFNNTVVVTPFNLKRETKSRTPVSAPALPATRLPVVSGKQLSILGSLIVLRSRGLSPT